ncbi:hypothetical protein LSCM1_06435 [Leishmania martiniquensis]|uniref:PPIase cyclophilin-type domain-containing protein n=1 Tax=Leishmania martiniquensis TaxID=1580590 RepID=A0A836H9E9_9TRYP|nr:hypothetical protein LSCM1_06435 [Leishmania martiniquensis]
MLTTSPSPLSTHTHTQRHVPFPFSPAMQCDLSFIFPHAIKEVSVSFCIPLSAQRPRTVANLFFMCTGQLPLPTKLLAALRLTDAEIAYATPDDAKAAGLLPLSDSAVIRIDKASVIEIGSSTTKSIFGGFIPDEEEKLPANAATRRQGIEAAMSSLQAGTVLCGNLGMPNTQASRYYILLEPVSTSEQRDEFAGFAPLGMVTSGLAELKKAAAQTAVQPRTLVPKREVVVSGCRVQLNCMQLAPAVEDGASASPLGGIHNGAARGDEKRRHAEPHERVAGRVRPRDEEEAQVGARNAPDDGDGNTADPDAAPLHSSSFFDMSACFPKAVAVSGSGPFLKRRRAEGFVLGADGRQTLRTTAIAPGDHIDGGGVAAKFDYFQAQQEAFMNDIDGIKEVQQQRWNRKVRKSKRAPQALASSRSSERHLSSSQHRRSGDPHSSRSSGSPKSGPKKAISKRY